MIAGDPGPLPVTVAEAQAYLRIESGEEEALLAGLLRSATGLCEAFTGQCLVARTVTERLQAGAAWQRLSATPVRSIDTVAPVGPGGAETPVQPVAYAIDIDRNGDGWVRLTGLPETLVTVGYSVGMAADGNGVPEPLRQGILRLTAHMFNSRDGDSGEPPAAVTALWRPYRRMRLA